MVTFSLYNTIHPTSVNKFLGVYFDSKLSWIRQIDHLCLKLAKASFAVRKIYQIVNKQAAITTYYGLFHSVLSYGILAWGNASIGHIQRIFIIQKSAVRSIVGAKFDEHCRPIFKYLGIMTLFSLIIFENLIHIRRNIHEYHRLSEQHNYSTRKNNSLIQDRFRLKKTKNIGITFYNALPTGMQTLPIGKFRSEIKKILIDMCLYDFEEFYHEIRKF